MPVTLSDLENNGRLCFVYTTLHEYVGRSSQSQQSPDIGSYTPYLVYLVDDVCKMNKELSKKYMDEHYVFAGFNYNEKILIRYPQTLGGKYVVWKKPYFK